MSVCVVGLGYVGLPTALLFAQHHEVVGVDIDESRVDALNRGQLPFEEPGLPELFEEVEENFSAAVAPNEDADVYIIVTPTPLDQTVDVADLTAVRAAAEAIGDVLSPGDLVVLESTVPPGTTERLVVPSLELGGLSRDQFDVAHCPERAIPGRTLDEVVGNDRVVGGLDTDAALRARDLYGDIVEGQIRTTDATTAEFVKLMENTHRDVNIALANEFAKIAEEIGVDVHDAIPLANEHPRVDVLSPGPGVGGHCITIDPRFLAQRTDSDRLISVARDVNDSMAAHVLGLVTDRLCGDHHATITVLGVAYKADVGDTRETPALPFVKLAENAGYEVRVHDPHVSEFAVDPTDLDTAALESDCLVVLTGHEAFADVDPERMAELMNGRDVVDARATLDREAWESAGFDVRVLGDGR